MNTYLRLSLFTCLLAVTYAQYGPQYRPQSPQPQQAAAAAPPRHYAPDPYINRPTAPPPLILAHKQALSHDGQFNFAFAADNGLQQGETISPDGTRQGGYSYVDPNGKKITIRYTAGKDGFRILEGDHVPRAPQPAAQPAPQPQQQYQQSQYVPQPATRPSYAPPQQYSAPQQYQAPQQYSAPQTFSAGHQLFRRPNAADDGQYRPELYEKPHEYNPQAYKVQGSQANALQEPDYHDEPGKPHSFGTGYAFEFAG